MNNEEAFKKFAIALGMSSFQAQSLEHTLVSLFAASAYQKAEKSKLNIREIMDTRYNQTLGKLIRDAAVELNLSESLTSELQEALKIRNWVTHHLVREYGAIGVSPELLAEATTKLESTWPILEKCAANIYELCIERQIASGLSREQIEKNIENVIQSYVSERVHT
jgi:hypothetical protein